MPYFPEELLTQFKATKNCLEKARILKKLHTELEWTTTQIGKAINYDQSYVSHLLRTLKLPEMVKDGYYSKLITCAHLIILSRLENEQDIIAAYRQVLEKSLSTAQTEMYIRQKKYHIETSTNHLSEKMIEQMKERLAQLYPGVSVKIIQSKIRGKVVLEFHGNTDKTSDLILEAVGKLCQKKEVLTPGARLIELD